MGYDGHRNGDEACTTLLEGNGHGVMSAHKTSAQGPGSTAVSAGEG
jgi:hypothetical protein